MAEELVTVATFLNLLEGHLAKGELEAEGIDCVLTDESTAGIYAPAAAIGGVRLQVRSEDAERAQELLQQVEPGPELAPPPPNVCPRCGSAEIEFVGRKLLSPLPAHWECRACDAKWVVEPDDPR